MTTPHRPSPYAAHRGFVAPAVATNAFGAVVIGVVIIEILYQTSVDTLPALLALFSPDFANSFSYGDTRSGLLAQLFSFALLALWVALVARLRHKRGFLTLTGPPAIALSQLIRAFVAVVLVFAATEVFPPYWDTKAIAETVSPMLWALTLPLSLLALFVQTGAEELMYRGYVQQQIAARWSSPWIWLTLPNLLFAGAHWSLGGDIGANLQYVIWAFFFGVAASDLTARAGNIGPAVGFHMANNAYAFLLYGELGGADSGLALFLFEPSDFGAPFDGAVDGLWLYAPLAMELGLVAVLWLATRLAIRR